MSRLRNFTADCQHRHADREQGDQPATTATTPVGAMTHDEYYRIAAACLPGSGLGSYALPDDVRFVIHKGAGSRLQEIILPTAMTAE